MVSLVIFQDTVIKSVGHDFMTQVSIIPADNKSEEGKSLAADGREPVPGR